VAQKNLDKLKSEIGKLFNKWRLEKKDGATAFPFNPDRPVEYVFNGFRKLIQKEDFKVDANDSLDFLHATVSLAYADFVLLDNRWTELAEKLKIPPDRVRVYSQKQADRFLEDLDQFKTILP